MGLRMDIRSHQKPVGWGYGWISVTIKEGWAMGLRMNIRNHQKRGITSKILCGLSGLPMWDIIGVMIHQSGLGCADAPARK